MPRQSGVLIYTALLCTLTGINRAQEGPWQAAPTASNPTLSFGMIGFGMAGIARLNVVNLVRTPPPVLIAQVPCKVELDLYDGQGKLIKQKIIANLGYGQADFLDALRFDVAASGTHVEVSGVVKVGSNQPFFCNISATLEVFDSVSGTTTAILSIPSVAPALVSPVGLNGPPNPRP